MVFQTNPLNPSLSLTWPNIRPKCGIIMTGFNGNFSCRVHHASESFQRHSNAHLCRSYPCPGSIAMIAFFHACRLYARSWSSLCCFRSLCTRSIHLSLGLPRGLFPPTFIVVTCCATFVSSLLIIWPNHERRFWVT